MAEFLVIPKMYARAASPPRVIVSARFRGERTSQPCLMATPARLAPHAPPRVGRGRPRSSPPRAPAPVGPASGARAGPVAPDIPGPRLIHGSVGSLTWGLIEAGYRGWGDTLIIADFATAAIMTATFIAVEARTKKPMVPLRFFRSSTFSGANMDAFAVSFLIAGVAFYMTLYQQNIHGFSPVRAWLVMVRVVIM